MRHNFETSSHQSFTSNHIAEVSKMDSSSNSSATSLLELAYLFDKATDAKYCVIKANQYEPYIGLITEKNLQLQT